MHGCKGVSVGQKGLCTPARIHAYTHAHEHADEGDRSVIVRDSLASAVGGDSARVVVGAVGILRFCP